MLEKTDQNVQKLSIELGKRKQKKLSSISQPNSKRCRKDEVKTGHRKIQADKVNPPEQGTMNSTTSSMVSYDNTTTPQTPTPLMPIVHSPPALQPFLSMTLADLLSGIQPPQPPRIVHAPCTPGSGRPPPLVHPGEGILGRPPPLSQAAQQDFGLCYTTPLFNAQPPQPTIPTRQNFGRRGRLFPQHPLQYHKSQWTTTQDNPSELTDSTWSPELNHGHHTSISPKTNSINTTPTDPTQMINLVSLKINNVSQNKPIYVSRNARKTTNKLIIKKATAQ